MRCVSRCSNPSDFSGNTRDCRVGQDARGRAADGAAAPLLAHGAGVISLETDGGRPLVPPGASISETPIRFPALDGYSLGGTVFASLATGQSSTVVLLSCGGGVPAARYARFARFLASEGISTLTYDYRGIGASRPQNLRGFGAVAEDWSELDCGGAITYLRTHYPRAEIVGIAHSIGALLIGGAPNIAEVTRFVFICAHTGYFGDYMARYRLPMALLWHLIMPLVTRVVGYFPAKILRLGEDLPAGIAMQWGARRRADLQPEATATDVTRARSMIARYKNVTGSVLVVGFSDDAFATESGTRRLLAQFPRLRPEVHRIAPSEMGMDTIGHFGFFRRDAETKLWPIVVRFLRRGWDTRCPRV